jgi:hypothetical protein
MDVVTDYIAAKKIVALGGGTAELKAEWSIGNSRIKITTKPNGAIVGLDDLERFVDECRDEFQQEDED